jgi:hypothetical protein
MSLLARLFGWLRRTPQQPILTEREAYERCHGQRLGDIHVTLKPVPKPRVLPRLGGDYLRRCFEERLEARSASLGHRAEGTGAAEPIGEGRVGAEDERPAVRVDEDPLELLRREAAAAANGRRGDDPVEALDAPEPPERSRTAHL